MAWFGKLEPSEVPLPQVQVLLDAPQEAPPDRVTQFIGEKPHAVYTIDGQPNDPHSVVCRDSNGQRECLRLEYDAVRLFKQMQSLEYFCSLPTDVGATHFECRKM